MTAVTVEDVVRYPDPGVVPAAHQLLVGPDDGYGDLALERVSLVAAAEPWRGQPSTVDRLVVVLAGHARVAVGGGVTVTLAPNEVVHVGRRSGWAVEVLAAGASGRLELLVLSAPGERPGA